MLSIIDSFLNRITMYRLVLYYLIALAAIAGVFGFLNIIRIDPIALAFSIAILICVCLIVNEVCAKIFKAQPNSESIYITALILALIITPASPSDPKKILLLVLVALIAMASKYVLAIHKKHIFNPAAVAIAISALALGQYASWWVGGNIPLLLPILIGGLLMTRKIQRFDLVLSFFLAALISCFIINNPIGIWEVIQKTTIHTSLFFFAFVMLTEPLTTPPNRPRRIIYGIVTGTLFAPGIHIGNIYSTPELALVSANLISYFLSPKAKYVLTLIEKREVGKNLYDFVFKPDKPITFKPGQYMEWTLGHSKVDTRGNRRYFTIASSPTEDHINLGVKFAEPGSSFKSKMLTMAPGETAMAGQLTGDFILPRDPKEKMVFIAGGIGVTPFRSMAKYMTDRGEKRDAILFYSVKSLDEIAYEEIFDQARERICMKTIYAITEGNSPTPDAAHPASNIFHYGYIDQALIEREVPDYKERTFYLSGPHAMVEAFKKTLRVSGVPRRKIRTDFFPGF